MSAVEDLWQGLPEGWRTLRNKFVFSERNERGRDDLPLAAVSQRYGVLEKRELEAVEGRKLSAENDDLSKYKRICFGDIVYNKMRMWQGAVGVAGLEALVSPAYVVARPTGGADPRFMGYLLKSERYVFQSGLLSYGICDDQNSLRWEDFADMRTPLPPVEQQAGIANFLDEQTARIDALIGEKESLVALLAESEASQVLHLVTGHHHGANEALNPERPALKALPAGWTLPQLARLVSKLTNGYVGPTRDILVSTGVRYLQSLHIKNGQIDFSRGEYFVEERWSTEHAKSILEAGDVLIVQTGDIGQTAVVTEEFAGCNCHALIIASPRRDRVVPEYLEAVLRSSYGRAAFSLYATGALHPHLNCSNIRDIRIPLPPPKTQQDIVRRISAVEQTHRRLVGHVQGHVNRLREYRSSLISAAVTGQLDLSAFKAKLPNAA